MAPARGSIVLDGDDLTRVSAEDRARRGVVQVRGADVFPGLTVDENLRAALVAHPALRRDAGVADRPGLRRVPRPGGAPPAGRGVAVGRRAADGGARVRAAVRAARCCWSTSCRSGWRRSCVQRLIDVLRGLRDAGQAMVIVEQSLAVAARCSRSGSCSWRRAPSASTVRSASSPRATSSRARSSSAADAVITVHGWDISQQMLLSGVVQGLAYAVLGAGIVLVYRASGVINFAVAAFGTTAVAFMAVLLGGGIGGWHAPFWVAFVLATLAAALRRRAGRVGGHPPAGRRAAPRAAGRDHRHRPGAAAGGVAAPRRDRGRLLPAVARLDLDGEPASC